MTITSMEKTFLKNIEDHKIVVGVIGLGYVGLPISLAFAEAGFKVLGLDINQNKIDKLNNGLSYINHIHEDRIKNVINNNKLEVSLDFSKISSVNAIIICVPTPLTIHHEPDLSFIINTFDLILPYLRQGQLLSLESTTYPGTTNEVIRPFIESKGFNIGDDFFLVYSPEREDPGNLNFKINNIPKLLGGQTSICSKIGKRLYEQIVDQIIVVSSPQVAEMTKLLENTYRLVNIGLINEIKIIADSMGLNIYEIINAAATKPFGFNAFYPGPGVGGHCIPIVPFYLSWKAKEYGLQSKFIELAGEINEYMPKWVVDKIILGLNSKEKPVNNSKILILGISYKKNIDDTRESSSIAIMKLLKSYGADLSYSDPHVPVFQLLDLKSVEITKETLSQADIVVLLTDHTAFDLSFISSHADLIVDTRGRFQSAPNIIHA